MGKRAVVLLSGGLDSATTLSYALDKGYECACLIFDYQQRHRKEILQAKKVANFFKCSYQVLKIALPWKGSALLDRTIVLPKNRIEIPKEIPITYVPARNIIFLSFAASYTEAIGARAIFIGANAIDYSGYPDCRPDFFYAFERVLAKGLKAGVEGQKIKIHIPLVKKTKAQIIRMGLQMKTPYHLTWSCYQGGRKPCGTCDSCILRAKGFQDVGVKDPTGRK